MFFVKLLLTAWVIILIPVYWKHYGLQNFLWFSDIALFGTVLALWLEATLLMNTIMLYALPVEILWCVDFFVYLFTSRHFVGIAYYMFEEKYSLFLRFLSLFHLILPFVWIWYVLEKGYDIHALPYAIILCWVTLILTYMFTDPQANINGVFYPEMYKWKISFNPTTPRCARLRRALKNGHVIRSFMRSMAVPTEALCKGWVFFLMIMFPVIYFLLHIFFLFLTNQKFA